MSNREPSVPTREPAPNGTAARGRSESRGGLTARSLPVCFLLALIIACDESRQPNPEGPPQQGVAEAQPPPDEAPEAPPAVAVLRDGDFEPVSEPVGYESMRTEFVRERSNPPDRRPVVIVGDDVFRAWEEGTLGLDRSRGVHVLLLARDIAYGMESLRYSITLDELFVSPDREDVYFRVWLHREVQFRVNEPDLDVRYQVAYDPLANQIVISVRERIGASWRGLDRRFQIVEKGEGVQVVDVMESGAP